jgi:hypothetical protein
MDNEFVINTSILSWTEQHAMSDEGTRHFNNNLKISQQHDAAVKELEANRDVKLHSELLRYLGVLRLVVENADKKLCQFCEQSVDELQVTHQGYACGDCADGFGRISLPGGE